MKISTWCFRCVGNENVCSFCGASVLIRYGYTKGGNQRLRCPNCKRTRVQKYMYKAYTPLLNEQIIKPTKEGLGIRSTARVLQISTTTLLRRLLKIANNIPTVHINKNKDYEVDELCTFIRNKNNRIWVVYALERSSKEVVCFSVGKRTNHRSDESSWF